MNEQESKPYYKIGEVCEITGTQPYVLRFWESEFPSLAPKKNRSGQRVYRKRDIELIRRIKALLYEKEYTIAGARKVLEGEGGFDEDDDTDSQAPTTTHADRASGASMAATHGGDAAHQGSSSGDRRSGIGGGRDPGTSEDARSSDHQYEAEVRNLRAKLAHVENELRTILADMDRRDRR